jgi:hypothetical protein
MSSKMRSLERNLKFEKSREIRENERVSRDIFLERKWEIN